MTKYGWPWPQVGCVKNCCGGTTPKTTYIAFSNNNRTNWLDGFGVGNIGLMDSNFNILWRKDLGLTTGATLAHKQPGVPVVDSSANIYFPWLSDGTSNHEAGRGIDKFDINGNLIWSFTDSTTVGLCGSVPGGLAGKIPIKTCFDINGNIWFNTNSCFVSGTVQFADLIFSMLVTPSGSLVQRYTYPAGAQYGTLNMLGQFDSNNNLWIVNDGSIPGLYEFDSSANLVGKIIGGGVSGLTLAPCSYLDRANSKLYLASPTGGTAPSSGSVVAQRISLPVTGTHASIDWTQTLGALASSIGISIDFTNSRFPGDQIGISYFNHNLYFSVGNIRGTGGPFGSGTQPEAMQSNIMVLQDASGAFAQTIVFEKGTTTNVVPTGAYMLPDGSFMCSSGQPGEIHNYSMWDITGGTVNNKAAQPASVGGVIIYPFVFQF